MGHSRLGGREQLRARLGEELSFGIYLGVPRRASSAAGQAHGDRGRLPPAAARGCRRPTPRSRRGGSGQPHLRAARTGRRCPAGGDRSRRRCRRALRRLLGAPPRNGLQRLLRATQCSEPLAALTGDEDLQAGANECGLLLQSGETLGLAQKVVIDVERRSHMNECDSSVFAGQRPGTRDLHEELHRGWAPLEGPVEARAGG